MKLKIVVIALALCLAMPAAAQFKAITEAYEVALEGFRAPTKANGGVVFRPCSTCKLTRLRVTADTLYKVKGERVRLDEFRRVIESAPDPEEVSVTVEHHLERNVIVMLDVWL